VRRALLLAGALCTVAALVAPGAAYADGDPASDVLVMQDAYYPYAPPTDARLRTALDGVLKRARASGFAVKVALIQAPADLGAYPTLFNKPNEYAALLARELPANRHGAKLEGQRILVVMPGGFGGRDLGDRVDEALAPIAIKASAESNGLAVAAIGAVARLATVNGHRIATPPEAALDPSAPTAKRRGGPSFLVFLVPALALFAGLFVAGRRAARRAS
jgi:hypothetical protein